MQAQGPGRKLVAILSADLAGYSRLMSVDEEKTLASLTTHRQEVLDTCIEKHGGRIVKSTGDGLLAEFPSAVNSVRCAVEIQTAMSVRNADLDDDGRLDFRIGINVGDVVEQGGDLFGDGVNISARLEQIAEPGGICVAQRVFEDIAGKVPQEFEDAGEETLKNIPRPIRIYRWHPSAAQRSAKARPALSLPQKPSIAVLPFQNISGDPEQDYLADGVVEDIITALARTRWLFVIARNSSFAYKGRHIDLKQVGRELGVGYLLEGSVRKAGERIRITGQLIDAGTGAHLWAETYDRPKNDFFAIQDELVSVIVGTLVGRLERAELERSARKATSRLDAHELVLRGRDLLHRLDDQEGARRLFEQAVQLDPKSARARVELALSYMHQFFWDDSATALATAERLAQEAIALDDAEAWAHMVLALSHIHSRRFEASVRHGERAVAINPNDAKLAAKLGLILADVGRAEEGVHLVQRAMRLDPFGSDQYCDYLGLALFAARRYRDALGAFELSTDSHFYQHAWLAACHAQLGNLDEARRQGRKVLELAPGLTVARFAEREPIRNPEDLKRWTDALALAGIP